GKLDQLGVDTSSSGAWIIDKNNFGPRLGFSYDVSGSGRIVIRGGIGVFYDALLHNYPYTMFLSPPSTQVESRSASTFNSVPFGNPFPNPPAVIVTPNTNINAIFPDSKNTYNTRWSLSVQRAIRENLLVDVAYVGSHSVRDRLTSNQNQPLIIGDANSRPYPQIGNITTGTTDGMSSYESGQLKVEQRNVKGMTFIGSYTWSKNM